MRDIDISNMNVIEVADLYIKEKQEELAQRGIDRNIVDMEARKQAESQKEREALRTQIRSCFK